MLTVSKKCNRCKQVKPLSEFYKRSGTANQYLSECKACMTDRNKTTIRLPQTQPRDATETIAIEYLKSKGIFALPGKAFKSAWVDVLAWGAVGIEVKWGVEKQVGKGRHFYFVTTPRQQERGFLGHLVLLICASKDGSEPTFHIFRNTDPVFYIQRIGDAQPHIKSGFTYYRGRKKAMKQHRGNTVLTDALMNAAQDNIGLIYETMATISRELMGA